MMNMNSDGEGAAVLMDSFLPNVQFYKVLGVGIVY